MNTRLLVSLTTLALTFTVLSFAGPVAAQEARKKIVVESSDARAPEESELGESRPRFDWNKYKGQRRVPHPDAQKGLMSVTKDKVYLYGTRSSSQKHAVSFRFGFMDFVNLENPDTAGQPNSSFEENYDSTSNPALLLEYEYHLFRFGFGKVAAKAGTGFYIAQGNGHFQNQPSNPNVTSPREQFTLVVVPTSVGAVARFQIWDEQLLVPYVDGGGTMFGMTEMRDDDQGPKFGGAFAAYWAVGGQFNISRFDLISRAQLDREYGINRIYFTGEYRNFIGGGNFDFSSDYFNGGFLLEF